MAGLAALACAPLGAAPAHSAAAGQASGKAWWAHVAYLASDDMKGRATGSADYDRAAEYVAGQFRKLGLKPAGTQGYLQPVQFTEQRIVPEQSSIALVDGTTVQPLTLGEDLILTAGAQQPQTVEAPLVFIGYGLHIPQAGYDDFAGQDLKGKILVAINGGPESLSAAVKSNARASQTAAAAAAAGALGVVTILTPARADIPWPRRALLALGPGVYLTPTNPQAPVRRSLNATINPDYAQKLFARSGHSFADILALAQASKPIPGFALNQALRAKVAATSRPLVSPNILAVLPGADPALAQEYVLVSAHLDHLGVGAPINGDAIYNGAMDDASGVASVLEIARAMKTAHARPRRSILFAVFTAEEKGLLGSRAFTLAPSVPKAGLAADLNMDMFLPLWPLKRIMIQGVDESSLGADARALAAAEGYEITTDPYPDRDSFTRTDQYSFVRAGIPALSLKFGFALGSPEQQIEKDWRTNRYHSPTDDLNQPVNLPAAAAFNSYFTALALRIADDKTRPAWIPTSPFAPH